MPSAMPPGPMRRLILPLMLLAVPGCVGAPRIAMHGTACSTLLPDEWKAGVAGAPLPGGQTAGDWIAFADAQTAQLDKANGRTADTIGIVQRCEARDAAAMIAARKRWWQFWK